MAQFDVHRNLGADRAAVPFVVVLQSRAHDHVPTRLVAPLLDGGAAAPLRPPATPTPLHRGGPPGHPRHPADHRHPARRPRPIGRLAGR
ncbi:hypothetical protein HB662_16980 [Roseomonas frigidaquae]|uniref:Toxin CcdB n=1 Tax=Falsiroseomonas frigidaquae TaxID=487318 RepID=A0ABX1F2C4_9PROT|nr:hypothetical protein [Falsiroseomonas frigidaquae]